MPPSDTERRRPHRATLLSAAAAVVVALTGLATAPVTAATTSGDIASEDDTTTEGDTTTQTEPVVGEVTRIAGLADPSGQGYSGDGGPATEARLNSNLEIAAAPDGTIYLADRGNGRVRAIDPDGTISTVARALRSPEHDVDLDVDGWIYSPSNRPISVDVADDATLIVGAKIDITRVTSDGETTVMAGGGDGGLPDAGESLPGDATTVYEAVDVTVASDGTVYAYLGGAGRIIAVAPDGNVRLLAGGGEEDRDDADGSRPATDYSIGQAEALAVADTGPYAGTVFFTAEQHSRVMAILPDGTLDVFAGTADSGFSGDGAPARDATLSEWVQGLAVTPDGDLLIADTFNAAIRRVDGNGVISTLRGAVGQVGGLDVLPDGDVVFTRDALAFRLTVEGRPAVGVIEPIEAGEDPFARTTSGEVVHLAGADIEQVDQRLSQEQFAYPLAAGVAVDADGAVVFADLATSTVRRIEPDGSTTVIAGVWPRPDKAGDGPAPDTVTANDHALGAMSDLATTPEGTLLIAEIDRIWELNADGTMTQIAGASQASGEALSMIRGIATDQEGAVYVADGELVRRIGPDGAIETIAGGGERWADDGDGHPATEATLWEPADVAVDSQGAVYVTEGNFPRVRQIAADGTISTVLGDSYRGTEEGGFGGDGGPGVEAEVNTPIGLAVGPDDALFVADAFNARVRRLDRDGTVTTVAGNGRQPGDEVTGGPAVETPLGEPTSVALDTEGNLVISTSRPAQVTQVTGEGDLELLAETDISGPFDQEAPATDVALRGVQDLAVGPDGVAYASTAEGTWAIDESVARFGASHGTRITSGDATYVAEGATVSRVLPDGRSALVAGGGALLEPAGPVPARSLHLGDVHDLAAGPEDSLFVLSLPDSDGPSEATMSLNQVTVDGLATSVDLGDTERLAAIATSPDGTLYGIDAASRQVLRFDGDGGSHAVVARDEETSVELADEPFGTATALPSGAPQDLAIGPEGSLFVAIDQGVLVVDPDEDSYAFHDGLWSGQQFNVRVSADRHGSVYALSHYADGQLARVSALVRPAQVDAPTQVSWAGLTAGAGSLVLLGGAVLIWRRRRPVSSSA